MKEHSAMLGVDTAHDFTPSSSVREKSDEDELQWDWLQTCSTESWTDLIQHAAELLYMNAQILQGPGQIQRDQIGPDFSFLFNISVNKNKRE